jgi:general secretion pathway protein D
MRRAECNIRSLMILLVVLAAGCATPATPPATGRPAPPAQAGQDRAGTAPAETDPEVFGRSNDIRLDETAAKRPTAELFRGSGKFIDENAARRPAYAIGDGGDVTLNFQGSDLEEVVQSILGDILKVNYAIDEKVKGKVYLQTSAPLARNSLIPTLEAVLRMKGAVLIKSNDLYKIVPQGEALSSAVSPDVRLFRDRGFQMLVIPLKYIAASEMQKILDPIKPSNGVIQVDSKRNFIMVAGTQVELAHVLKTVKIFDVDQLKGMSVGLYPLTAVDPETMIGELAELLDGQGALAGMLRFMPLERLNAVLAISPQAQYLERVRDWIERLDRVTDETAVNLYVYHVQHGRADHLADVLNQLIGGAAPREREEAPGPPQLAPGSIPAIIGSEIRTGATGAPQRGGQPQSAMNTTAGSRNTAATLGKTGQQGNTQGSASGTHGAGASTLAGMRGGDLDVGTVTIIADDSSNALLIKATAADYAKIEQLLRRLDLLPLQVLVETSIIDVALTGDFSFGVEWFFKNNLNSKTGFGRLDTGGGGIAPIVPGFSYSIVDAADVVRFVLNTLASEGKANILSSPSLMVLDNRTASIRIGDQVPIRTATGSSIASSGVETIIASSISMVDTGVMLQVTPRVNKSGVVMMEITQEVNTVEPTTSSGIDSPTINQRSINTTVSVRSGETIVLGGLIIDRRTRSETGVPGLRNVPGLGWLFGSRQRQAERSELLVLITPTAVRDESEAKAVTEEFRDKMKGIFEYKDAIDSGQLPPLLERGKGKIRP